MIFAAALTSPLFKVLFSAKMHPFYGNLNWKDDGQNIVEYITAIKRAVKHAVLAALQFISIQV